MMQRRDYLKCLDGYNQFIREKAPTAVLQEEEFFRLVNGGAFGQPAALTPDRLIMDLVHWGIAQVSSRQHDVIPPFPDATQEVQACRWNIQEYPLRGFSCEALYDQKRLDGQKRIVGFDYIARTALIAEPRKEPITYSGQRLFNAFTALDLEWTLRDQQGRVPRPKHAAGCRLSLYPEPQDRQTIVNFLEAYGPNFLPGGLVSFFPPDDQPSIVKFFDVVGDDFYPDLRLDPPVDFFSEFTRWYLTFTRDVERILSYAPPAPGQRDTGLAHVQSQINHVGLRADQHVDGAMAPTFEIEHGLQLCYVTLLDFRLHHPQKLRRCALPSCQRHFIYQRKDQQCCSPRHADRYRHLSSARQSPR